MGVSRSILKIHLRKEKNAIQYKLEDYMENQDIKEQQLLDI
jgi:hypothetical protein